MSKQTKSNNNAALSGFALTLVIIILAVCVMAAMTNGFTDWNPYGWFDDKPAEDEKNNAPIDAIITNSEYVGLTMSAATTAGEDESNTYSVLLTATVLPLDAPDKSVDWNIEWDVAPMYGENPVTDYVTVIPQFDGSNVATITCIQGFGTDTIVVTVTTRVGGYKAECELSYAGLPTTFNITVNDGESSYDEGWGFDIINLYSDTTYTCTLNLDNELHYIGENFEPSYTCSVAGFGSFNYNFTKKVGINGTPTTEQRVCNFLSDDPVDVGILENLVTVNFDAETGTLSLISKMTVASYYTKEYFDSHRSYEEYQFVSYTDPTKVPYFEITVTENNTGLSSSIKIHFNSVVTGVSLDTPSIVF